MDSKHNTSIVLTGTHVPSILNPEWLKKEAQITETPLNFVNTQQVSAFESKSYSMVMDSERFQLSLKNENIDQLDSLILVLDAYLQLFQNVKYNALGINFKWTVHYDKDEKKPSITFNIGNLDIGNILPNHDFMFGSIIKANTDTYKMNLSIEPVKNNLIYTFNFHHEVNGKSIGTILQYLKNYKSLFELTQNFVKITSGDV